MSFVFVLFFFLVFFLFTLLFLFKISVEHFAF